MECAYRLFYRSTGTSAITPIEIVLNTKVTRFSESCAMQSGGVYSTERNGTERNHGLNYGTERFLKMKPAAYHC